MRGVVRVFSPVDCTSSEKYIFCRFPVYFFKKYIVASNPQTATMSDVPASNFVGDSAKLVPSKDALFAPFPPV
jgi:hypothetical protein